MLPGAAATRSRSGIEQSSDLHRRAGASDILDGSTAGAASRSVGARYRF
jgi:hypothetical protein